MIVPHDFDERAATWDDDEKMARAASVAATIVKAVAPSPSTRLLEYGAGTGLVSQFLAPYVGAVTLADASTGMRTVAHKKISAGVLPAGTRVWDLNLDSAAPSDEKFDLIVTVLTLHHVVNVHRVLAGFAEMLTPSGRLCIVDLEKEDGSFHDESDDVAHGFEHDELAAQLVGAGMNVEFHDGIYSVMKNDEPYPLFLAVAALV